MCSCTAANCRGQDQGDGRGVGTKAGGVRDIGKRLIVGLGLVGTDGPPSCRFPHFFFFFDTWAIKLDFRSLFV